MTCRVVAELSANHNGSLATALALVEAAADAGAWAVKLQTWDPASMVLDPDYTLRTGPWAGRKLAELYAQAQTPWEWHKPIFERAWGLGLEAFSSVFDLKSLGFLEEIGCRRYKIASFEAVDLPLIRTVAATGRPIVISTGMASLPEIEEAYQNASSAGCRDITLLKCTSAYPAEPKDVNLRTMLHMKQRFPTAYTHVGLSDHTQGIAVAVVAASMGAEMIEKHLTLSRADGGLDAAFSIEPAELAQLVQEVDRAAVCAGQVVYGPRDAELPQLELRRSLYFTRDLAKGEQITQQDVTTARPARGIHPRFMGRIVGRRTATAVRRGQPVQWDATEEGGA